MIKPITACPNVAEMADLVRRPLRDSEADTLASHFEQCPSCAQQMEAILNGDRMEAAMRETAGALDATLMPDARELIERLKKVVGSAAQTSHAAAAQTAAEGTQCWESDDAAESLHFLRPSQQADELGRLGQYRLLKKLGAGGMGMVFLAEDTLLHRKVAFKLMLPQYVAKPGAKERFLREARAAASIEHDNIVPIFQVGEDNGVPFLAMQFLKGEPLDACLAREGKLPVAEALRVAASMAEGLAAAHANNLIHRDIKPSNVWLEARGGATPPRVRLLDFGLARTVDDTSQLTQAGMIVGTPAFMAPEQAKGGQIDGRADLFSLGCVLYLMLTGQLPFKGKDTLSLLTSLALDTPQTPTILNFDVPTEVSDLTMHLLAKDAGNRPPTAAAVVEVLARLQAPSASRTTPAPKAAAAVPPKRRRRGALVAVAALFLAGIAFAVYQVVIIRDKDGNKVAEIRVPEGGRVEVASDVKQPDAKASPSVQNENPNAFIPAVRGKYALAFNELDHVSVSSLKLDNAHPLTIEGYVTPLTPENRKPFLCTYNGIYLCAGRTWGVVIDNQTTSKTVESAIPVRPGQRTHVAAVFTGRRMILFVDGEVAVSQEYEPSSNAHSLHVGGDGSGGTAPGLIEEVRVSRSARYEKSFKPADRFEPDADTLALYHFDDGAGEIVKDSSGNGHHGKVVGGSWVKTSSDWATQVAGLPAELQAYAVLARLMELNPGFDGTGNYKVNDGVVTELRFLTVNVADISPVRALAGLRRLDCCGVAARGKLKDLRPLSGLKLNHLDCSSNPLTDLSPVKDMPLYYLSVLWTPVADLSPLKGVPLNDLHCGGTKVTDLSPLKGLPLKFLHCGGNQDLKDLSPIAGMKLEQLDCDKTSITDLSPIKDVPLKRLTCDYVSERDATILRAVPTLETINGKPAKEFVAPGDTRGKYALLFDQRSARVSVQTLPLDPSHPLTLEAYVTQLGELNNYTFLYNYGGIYLNGGKKWSLGISHSFGIDSGAIPVQVKKRTHLAAVFTGKQASLFVDGELIVRKDYDASLAKPIFKQLSIGAEGDGASCNGLIEEVRVSSVARYEKKFEPAVRFEPDANTRALYHLDEGAGDIVKDSSGNGHHAKITGGARWVNAKEYLAAHASVDEAWVKSVAALPTDQKAATVAAKLKELNPDFDGNLKWSTFGGPDVASVDISGQKVANLSPLRALQGLESFTCTGCPVWDLSPLRGLKLKRLMCEKTSLYDLYPLAGMPLEILKADGVRISDLSPLKGMPLVELRLHHALVKNLAPLRGIKLQKLSVGETAVTDLGPLAGMPLNLLEINGTKVADLKPLTGMPLATLQCNNCPNIADLAPLAGLPLESLAIGPCPVGDLSPLRGMKLKTLECDAMPIADLAPVAGMPLEKVRLTNTKVADLSALKGLPIRELRCNLDLTRDGEILRSIKTLETINGKPAKDVLGGQR